jgi:hypothetical protein
MQVVLASQSRVHKSRLRQFPTAIFGTRWTGLKVRHNRDNQGESGICQTPQGKPFDEFKSGWLWVFTNHASESVFQLSFLFVASLTVFTRLFSLSFDMRQPTFFDTKSLFWSCAFALSQVNVASAFAQCYYPDGSIPTDYDWQPCTGAQYSSCCIPSEGDICQENGLCYFPDEGLDYRGTCTDITWTDPSCPQICVNGEYFPPE